MGFPRLQEAVVKRAKILGFFSKLFLWTWRLSLLVREKERKRKWARKSQEETRQRKYAIMMAL